MAAAGYMRAPPGTIGVMAPEPSTLHAAGLAEAEVAGWHDARPALGEELDADAEAASGFFLRGAALVARLPPKPDRAAGEQAAVDEIKAAADDVRDRFMRRHTRGLYAQLTANGTQAVRAEELV